MPSARGTRKSQPPSTSDEWSAAGTSTDRSLRNPQLFLRHRYRRRAAPEKPCPFRKYLDPPALPRPKESNALERLRLAASIQSPPANEICRKRDGLAGLAEWPESRVCRPQ